MTQHVLVRDIETRSELDLEEVGIHRYAQHPSTKAYCVSYAVDDGPVKLWLPGQPIPKPFKQAATSKNWLMVAHNNSFERMIERHVLKFPEVPLERQRCLMAIAMALALPGSLDGAAEVLNLKNQKNTEGRLVMLQLAKPRKARRSKKEDPNKVYWVEDEEKLQTLYRYCMEDTEAEREMWFAIPELSSSEQSLWEMDQRINDHGFHVDRRLAEAASNISHRMRPMFDAELAKITNGEVTSYTQVARIKIWIEPHCGKIGLNKTDIAEMMGNGLPKEVERVLQLRLLGAQAAVSKVDALLQRLGPDDRLRGAFIFHAAGPGRWSSRGAQVHNLKRSMTKPKELDTAVELIMKEDIPALQEKYSNPLSVIGDCLRSMIKAKPGCKLVGGDFSGIEARVTAWVADEERKLDVFRAYDAGEGPDPYLVAAADIDGVDVNDLAKEYAADEPLARESRQRGKAAELAFGYQGAVNAYRKFAPDTPLDDDAIQRIKNKWRSKHPNIERFWFSVQRAAAYAVQNRGEQVFAGRIGFECDDQPFLWMTLPSGRRIAYPHARWLQSFKLDTGHLLMGHPRGRWGVHFKDSAAGQWRDVQAYGGLLCLGADTQILTTEGWKQIVNVQKSDKVWDGVEWVSHQGVVYRGVKETAALDGVRITADHEVLTDHGWIRAAQAQGLHRTKIRLPDSSQRRRFDRTEASLETTMHLRQDNRSGEQRVRLFENTIMWMQEKRNAWRCSTHSRDVQTSGVFCLALDAGSVSLAYASSLEKLRWAWNQGLSALEEVREFLGRHGANIQTWASPRSQEQRQGLLQSELSVDYPHLESTQPTKQLHDQYAMGKDDDYRSGATFGAWKNNSALPYQSYAANEMVYDLVNCGPRKRFVVRGNTEPFIVHNCENIVQGIARDLLAEAMVRVEDEGFVICLHVHDECIIEVPEKKLTRRLVKRFAELMMTLPPWAEGLPVVVKPWVNDRYTKG